MSRYNRINLSNAALMHVLANAGINGFKPGSAVKISAIGGLSAPTGGGDFGYQGFVLAEKSITEGRGVESAIVTGETAELVIPRSGDRVAVRCDVGYTINKGELLYAAGQHFRPATVFDGTQKHVAIALEDFNTGSVSSEPLVLAQFL